MRPLALRVIQDEHRALAAMLRSMQMLLAPGRREQPVPFDVLRSMLLYVDEFPERLHHPKETAMLFPAVRRVRPDLAATLDKLDADHQRGEAAIREVEHRLLAWEVMGDARRDDFVKALDRYVDGYMQHMSLEESTILPAAEQSLAAADWQALDAAFAANRDPLTGHAAEATYQPLFSRIVQHAPAPVGLG